MEIIPCGRFFEVDASGYLLNAADHSRICEPWRHAVDALVAACEAELGSAMHSLYVRGSVAHGDAITGVSDLDCFLLLTRETSERDRAWRDEYVASFPRVHSFVTHLELPFRPLEQVLVDPERERTRFLLATQSACVFGEDIRPHLPRYRRDERIVFFARRLETTASRARSRDGGGADDVEARSNSARAILRAGAEIAMLRGQSYTRDLYPAYRLATQILPESEQDLLRILKIGIGMDSEDSDWDLLASIASKLMEHVPEALRS